MARYLVTNMDKYGLINKKLDTKDIRHKLDALVYQHVWPAWYS